ncbi:hypothetical protein PR048_027345 [Dryococelus australis]|uniref:Uncharacterized protein n=1 Tax=Dryococelus australis TaxID=614101 RepID=A0ABQ9GF69_9NEOP|nr:hypothetical protein PR048_027345 [Dryococelus australis]
MEQRRNVQGRGKLEIPEKTPPTSGIVRHEFPLAKIQERTDYIVDACVAVEMSVRRGDGGWRFACWRHPYWRPGWDCSSCLCGARLDPRLRRTKTNAVDVPERACNNHTTSITSEIGEENVSGKMSYDDIFRTRCGNTSRNSEARCSIPSVSDSGFTRSRVRSRPVGRGVAYSQSGFQTLAPSELLVQFLHPVSSDQRRRTAILSLQACDDDKVGRGAAPLGVRRWTTSWTWCTSCSQWRRGWWEGAEVTMLKTVEIPGHVRLYSVAPPAGGPTVFKGAGGFSLVRFPTRGRCLVKRGLRRRHKKRCLYSPEQKQLDCRRGSGGAVARALVSHTTAIRVRSPAGSLPDFRMWESYWTMPLAGGFLGVLPFPSLTFQRRSILGIISCHVQGRWTPTGPSLKARHSGGVASPRVHSPLFWCLSARDSLWGSAGVAQVLVGRYNPLFPPLE